MEAKLSKINLKTMHYGHFATQPQSPPTTFYRTYGKRIFDITLALCLLPLVAGIIAGAWLIVRRDGGAGFFGHTRIGRYRKPFKCWKIRTMSMNSEQRLREYLAENEQAAVEWERDFKLTKDPRITSIGYFLRKTSLDELPQIWNVLRGEMSFVGPRPITRVELGRYGDDVGHYHTTLPGITGLWQVSGRNDVSYERRVALDVQYAQEMSLTGDLKIILLTVTTVVGMTGK